MSDEHKDRAEGVAITVADVERWMRANGIKSLCGLTLRNEAEAKVADLEDELKTRVRMDARDEETVEMLGAALEKAESECERLSGMEQAARVAEAEARAELDRLVEGLKKTADANHEATAHAKAGDIADYFIESVLKTNWDRDHMTRVLEGWLVAHTKQPRAAIDAAMKEGKP